jgi:hypothetical protein
VRQCCQGFILFLFLLVFGWDVGCVMLVALPISVVVVVVVAAGSSR